jgi:pimeloyl-ACP methyl ester carboxylesterase/catechol 2,3-dioxygenase-like lactoylglutathione lyase family enzyme
MSLSMPCRRLPPVLLLALLAALLARLAIAAAPVPRTEPYPLTAEDGRQVTAELGRLSVLEDRQNPGATARHGSAGRPGRPGGSSSPGGSGSPGSPGGRRLDLVYVRLPSTARQPGAPIVYLAGGPGGAGTAALKGKRLEMLLALREVADVVVFDQRGTGLSEPRPSCAETWLLPLDRPLERSEMLAQARQHSRACAAELRQDGVDLAAYNTNASADDLDDLRRALGARKISLLGVSYGSQLALAAMRRHPAGLERVVLAGVEGPDQTLRLPSQVQRLLAEVSAAAHDDPQAAMPDLVGSLRRLLDRLQRQPVTVEVQVSLALKRVVVTAGRRDLEWMLAQRLASREGIAGLPALVHDMERGDFTALGEFAQSARRGWLGAAMPYAVQCASGVSAERLARIRREEPGSLLGSDLDFPFPGICEAWGRLDLGAAFRAPVRSAVPALLVSGTLDARTPPANAKEVRAGLSRSVELVVEGGGHGDDLLLSSPEALGFIRRFLAGETLADARVELPRLAFAPDPAAAAGRLAALGPAAAGRLEVVGLRINVLNLDRALAFYQGLLGCELVSRSRDALELRSGAVRMSLHKVEGMMQSEYPRQADIHMSFQVKDLAALVAEMRRRGVEVIEPAPQRAAIGSYNTVKDPAGNVVQLIQLDAPAPGAAAPAVWNVDVRVTDIAEARAFYVRTLGFEVFSEDFFPPDVPLKKAGAVALVLQQEASAKAPVGYSQVARTIVRLGAGDFAAARADLARRGVRFLEFPQERESAKTAVFADPAGNVLELVEIPRADAAGSR